MNPTDALTFRERLGIILKGTRKYRRMSQQFVAKKMGCSQVTILRYEKGRQAIDIDHLVRLFFILSGPVE